MKNQNELVTVIVPIYKVEMYLERCVSSILNQSYQNLDVLLIDDGSPDSCGSMCDVFANSDNRIRVIHQNNKGLAETRNIGVANAIGNYIVFIDSDDYIEPNMISTLYNNLKSYKADLSCCGHLEEYPHGYTERNCFKDFIKVYTAEQALRCFLFTSEIDVVSWNKLYKKELFRNVVFPSGKLYEDHYTIYKLIDNASKIVYDSTPLYHYCKRDSSIGGVAFNNKTLQLRDALLEECSYITSKYPTILSEIEIAKITWLIVVYNKMLLSDCVDESYLKALRKDIRGNMAFIVKSTFIEKIRKVQLLLLYVSPFLYAVFYRKYIKKYRGIKA